MSEQGGREHKVGITIGIISMYQIPAKWVEYIDKWRSTIPGGMFWSFEYVIGKYYDEARNEIVRRARKTNSKWVFFIDTDVFIPRDALVRLMSHNKDIVTGLYWMKTYPPQPVVFEQIGNGPIWDVEERDGLIPIGGSGAGCLLVNMSVFDAFDKAGIPYFKCDWDYVNGDRKIKVAVGEDHYFFIKAKELGFQTWLDCDVLCDHYDVKNDIMYPGEETTKRISKNKLIRLGKIEEVKKLEWGLNEESDKPTVIFYNKSCVPFNGDTLKYKPLGGTETDLIMMAKEMKESSCNVKVFCNCDKEGIYDGVIYFHYTRFDASKQKADVFISNRDNDVFKQDIKANLKFIWGHDIGSSPIWNGVEDIIDKVNGIFALSQFHAKTIKDAHPNIPIDKIIITRNGVDTNLYKSNVERDRYKLIYTSTPFRGLDILLECFPKIKEQVPEVTLDIYSGMSLYGAEDNEDMLKLYLKASKMIDVRRFEPVTQDKLALIQKSARLLVYPNTFPETWCCTVGQAIVAGTPIVTSNFGALPETIGKCGILIDLQDREKYKEIFIQNVIKLLRNEKEWDRLHDECKLIDYSWKSLCDIWLNSFFGKKFRTKKDWVNSINSIDRYERLSSESKILKELVLENPAKISEIIWFIDNVCDGTSVLYLGSENNLFGKLCSIYKPNCKLFFGKDINGIYDYIIIDKKLETQNSIDVFLGIIKNYTTSKGLILIMSKLHIDEINGYLNKSNMIGNFEEYNGLTRALVKTKGG